jgi:hypothetical protein
MQPTGAPRPPSNDDRWRSPSQTRRFCIQAHENSFSFFSLFIFCFYLFHLCHTYVFCVYVNQLTEMHVWFRIHTHTLMLDSSSRWFRVGNSTVRHHQLQLSSFFSLYWTAPIKICVNAYLWPRCYECTMKSILANELSQGAIPSWCAHTHPLDTTTH